MYSPGFQILSSVLAYLVLALLVEALTQLFTKSYIFQGVRFRLSVTPGLEILLSCGYCFSFWVSFFLVLLTTLVSDYLVVWVTSSLLNFLISWVLVQRLSNFVHGAFDRYFDTRKDIRYNKLKDN